MEGAGEGAARRRDVEACELAGKRRDDEASGSQIACEMLHQMLASTS
jgi:hypothetical protein